jgi:hypothetical protein
MKIGYGKLGRSMPLTLEKCGNLGGDVEMVAVIKQLAELHPDDDFYLLGRNSGEDPQLVGLPANVVNPWVTWGPRLREVMRETGLNKGLPDVASHQQLQRITDSLTGPLFREMDAHIWWVGQHGTSNTPLPSITGEPRLTKPHDWSAHYCGYVLRGINSWQEAYHYHEHGYRREPVWLNADPRNRHKMRDLKYPLMHPVLTQFNFDNNLKHEQYDGTPLVESVVHNVYSGLEVNGLAPGTPFGKLIEDAGFNHQWSMRDHFGLFINEARKIGVAAPKQRLTALRDWVLPLEPAFIHGTWSEGSQQELGRVITPAPWKEYIPKLQSVRCTLTTPSSGSGWATTKPWEAFAAGTVCFFHPRYDTQGNILEHASDAMQEWLPVTSPRQLRDKVEYLQGHPEFWGRLVHEQRTHFDNEMTDPQWRALVETRVWGQVSPTKAIVRGR